MSEPGLSSYPAKVVTPKGVRGFKSHSFRNASLAQIVEHILGTNEVVSAILTRSLSDGR